MIGVAEIVLLAKYRQKYHTLLSIRLLSDELLLCDTLTCVSFCFVLWATLFVSFLLLIEAHFPVHLCCRVRPTVSDLLGMDSTRFVVASDQVSSHLIERRKLLPFIFFPFLYIYYLMVGVLLLSVR